jgi:hypothetical protein
MISEKGRRRSRENDDVRRAATAIAAKSKPRPAVSEWRSSRMNWNDGAVRRELSANGRQQPRCRAAQSPRAQRRRDRRFQIFPRRDEAVMDRHSPRPLIQVAGQALVRCWRIDGGRLMSARGDLKPETISEPFNPRSQGAELSSAPGWLTAGSQSDAVRSRVSLPPSLATAFTREALDSLSSVLAEEVFVKALGIVPGLRPCAISRAVNRSPSLSTKRWSRSRT